MVKSWGLLLIFLIPMAGCARETMVEPLTIDHPASPGAAEASYNPSRVLEQEPQDAARTRPQEGSGHDVHGGAGHSHDRGAGAAASQPQLSPDSDLPYLCPMHPDVVRKKAGNCPRCGMKLVRKKEAPQ